MDDRLYRSRDDRMIAGVAGGVAEHLDADPSIIRVVWAVLVFLTGGLALLVYIVMAIVVPERPAGMPVVPRGGSDAPAPDEPVAPGSWRAPDGSTVPMASTTVRRERRRRDPADRARVGFVVGAVLIGLGALALIRQFLPTLAFDLWWPGLLIGLGIVLIVVAVMPGRRSS